MVLGGGTGIAYIERSLVEVKKFKDNIVPYLTKEKNWEELKLAYSTVYRETGTEKDIFIVVSPGEKKGYLEIALSPNCEKDIRKIIGSLTGGKK